MYGVGEGRGGERRDVEVHCDAFRRLPATPSARVLCCASATPSQTYGYSVASTSTEYVCLYMQKRGMDRRGECPRWRSWMVCQPRLLHPTSMTYCHFIFTFSAPFSPCSQLLATTSASHRHHRTAERGKQPVMVMGGLHRISGSNGLVLLIIGDTAINSTSTRETEFKRRVIWNLALVKILRY